MGSHLKLDDKDYKVIGIDTYNLTNFLDGFSSWQSFTLLTSDEQKAWISLTQGENYYVRWKAIPKSAFEDFLWRPMTLNLRLSGMAMLSFEGDPGYSTPFAETCYFDVTNCEYDFLATERFLEIVSGKLIVQETMYMIGWKLGDLNTAGLYRY
jgi:hypothetical protein